MQWLTIDHERANSMAEVACVVQDWADKGEEANGRRQPHRRAHLPNSQLLPLRYCWLVVLIRCVTGILLQTAWHAQGDRQLCNLAEVSKRLYILLLLAAAGI